MLSDGFYLPAEDDDGISPWYILFLPAVDEESMRSPAGDSKRKIFVTIRRQPKYIPLGSDSNLALAAVISMLTASLNRDRLFRPGFRFIIEDS
jgi:hypothetical protein